MPTGIKPPGTEFRNIRGGHEGHFKSDQLVVQEENRFFSSPICSEPIDHNKMLHFISNPVRSCQQNRNQVRGGTLTED